MGLVWSCFFFFPIFFSEKLRNRHWLMKCHQLTRTAYLLKQEACDKTYRARLPNTDSKDKLCKVITKFTASVSLRSQRLPPSPQEMKAMLPRKLYLLYRRFFIVSISFKGPSQVTHACGYHMIRHLNTQPKTREFEILAVWSQAANESQVFGREQRLQTQTLQ